jgi:hypothetical protein
MHTAAAADFTVAALTQNSPFENQQKPIGPSVGIMAAEAVAFGNGGMNVRLA